MATFFAYDAAGTEDVVYALYRQDGVVYRVPIEIHDNGEAEDWIAEA